MRALDLIPPEIALKREAAGLARQRLRRLVLTVAACTLLLVASVQAIHLREARVREMEQRYGWLEQRLNRAREVLGKRDELSERAEAASLVRSEATVTQVLAALGTAMTPASRLRSLNLERCPVVDTAETVSGSAEPCLSTLTVSGTASDHKEVGTIIRNLISSGEFVDVALVSSRKVEERGKPETVDFEIMCTLEITGGGEIASRYGTLEDRSR